MASIFISYRREDAPGYAGRIHDRFVERLGREQVFLDVDRIDPGADFEQVIKERLQQCAVFLAVIGPRWLELSAGRRLPRIFEDQDFVRVELRTALASGARVIPVLVAGAPLPRSVELPMDIAALVRRQAVVLGDADFHHDVGNLIDLVAGVLGHPAPRESRPITKRERLEPPSPTPVAVPPKHRPRHRRTRWWPAIWRLLSAAPRRAVRTAIFLLLAGGLGLYLWNALPAGERKKLTRVVTDGKDLIGSVVPAGAREGKLPFPLPTSLRGPAVERPDPARPVVLDAYPVSNRDFLTWLDKRRGELAVQETNAAGAVGQVIHDARSPLAALYLKEHPAFSAAGLMVRGSGDGFRTRNSRGAHPVRAVSWYAADAYCRQQGKRLPTAVEWLGPRSTGSAAPRTRAGSAPREWLADAGPRGIERQVVITGPTAPSATGAEPAHALPGDVSFRCAR